jgi:hypothetical protein
VGDRGRAAQRLQVSHQDGGKFRQQDERPHLGYKGWLPGVRVDAETIDTITFGGFLARINKGTRIHVEYTYVNGEVWLPKRETFTASARLLLLKGFHQEGDSTFSNYEKFTIDSRFIGDR